ncbi:F-type H+-transporting ATPase subunit epsilon [Friedmanniella luteola]|uniref:ATP synthase epsilon chain n=1 Tax=Friedmanniella luteola TaxID=546871 RepID=A0A1H1V4L0_9ACTN|nr:F0F1 ATP synthase subunit epsilon [Friedmanniella luteola]SDS79550.1 F-type H+-transporting ATPase subunit epsilon [Friedmanniella luteola]
MADPMQVEVVAADRVVWSGTSSNIIAKTVEGEIGILPGHSPLLAVLEPSAVVIFCDDGKREVVAVEGGFISVSQGRVSILSEYARLSTEMSLRDAERELDAAQQVLDSGDYSDDDKRRFDRANAQLRAAQKAQ